MENKAHAMAAGIFVVVMTVLLIALASWLTRDTGSRDAYEISTRESVTGLQSQAPVRYRGVDVGKVASIDFDPKAQGNVLLHLEIDRNAPVTRDTFAMLNMQGITGLAFVQLDDHGKPAPRLTPEDGHPPRIPLQPSLLSKLESQGEEILGKVDEATVRINKLLSDENQRRFSGALASLDTAASSASELTKHLDATVTERLDPALAAAPAALHALQKNADEVGKTAADFDATARRLNERNGPIDRLAEGTDALSHAADSFNSATLPRLNRVADETSRAVRQLGRTAGSIGDNPQALIYGTGKIPPGPGEPGFQPPGATR